MADSSLLRSSRIDACNGVGASPLLLPNARSSLPRLSASSPERQLRRNQGPSKRAGGRRASRLHLHALHQETIRPALLCWDLCVGSFLGRVHRRERAAGAGNRRRRLITRVDDASSAPAALAHNGSLPSHREGRTLSRIHGPVGSVATPVSVRGASAGSVVVDRAVVRSPIRALLLEPVVEESVETERRALSKRGNVPFSAVPAESSDGRGAGGVHDEHSVPKRRRRRDEDVSVSGERRQGERETRHGAAVHAVRGAVLSLRQHSAGNVLYSSGHAGCAVFHRLLPV